MGVRKTANRIVKSGLFASFLVLFAVHLPLPDARADNNPVSGPSSEVLGLFAPSIAIAPGQGIVSAGIGLEFGPGVIDLKVPSNVTVNQVLLYWEGRGTGDASVTVNNFSDPGVNVTGSLIGESGASLNGSSSAYRADITAAGLVVPGDNVLEISNLDFGFRSDGASVLVIYSGGRSPAIPFDVPFDIRDGNDFAAFMFLPGNEVEGLTVPQTYNFTAANTHRFMEMVMFVGDTNPNRPEYLEYTIDGATIAPQTTRLVDFFIAGQGPQWSNRRLPIVIPPGAESLVVELVSARDPSSTLPADAEPESFSWVGGIANFNPNASGVIGNRVWLDENSDGLQDAGEPGIGNVEVGLFVDGVQITSTLTDSNGGYLFSGLPAMRFAIRVDPNGNTLDRRLTQTVSIPFPGADFSNQSQPSYTVDLGAGEENLTADFGYNWAPQADVLGNDNDGALGDRVWIDSNANGLQDPGEPGAGGVMLQLSDADGNFVVTTTTAADGSYIFDDLPAGAYRVRVLDANFAPGGALEGTVQTGGFPSDEDNFTSVALVLAPGDVFLNVDFGYLPAASAMIGDTVYFDADGNGRFDAAVDLGIPGVSVALVVGGQIVAVDISDADGRYAFGGLADGDYEVVVNDTDNVLGELAPSGDPDGGLDNRSALSLSGLLDDLEQDFGYAPPSHEAGKGLLGDTVYLDVNGNGVQEPGESGIEGVRVSLFNGSRLLAFKRTDENGRYAFGNLPAGTYTVKVSAPSGYANSADPFGAPDSESEVTIGAGGIDLEQDFGYRGTGVIGTLVWEDLNADGVRDAGEGEVGIENVSIDLYLDVNGNGQVDPGEPRIANTVTGFEVPAGENYLFEGIAKQDRSGTLLSYIVDVSDSANILNGYWHSLGDFARDNHSQDDPYCGPVVDSRPGNLAVYLAFEDGSGSVAADANGNSGVLVNMDNSDWVAGLVGGALDFDGVNDRVDLGDFDVDGTGLTLRMLVKAQDFDNLEGRFISKAEGINGYQHFWMLSTINGTALRFRLKTATSGTTTTLASATGELQPGVWYDIAATYDESTGVMRIYKNGVEIASAAHADGGAVAMDAGVPVSIGHQPQGGDAKRAFKGLIDEVQIYDVALSAEQLLSSQLSACGTPDNRTADFGYYIRPAGVGNFVWNDLDGDGVQDKTLNGDAVDEPGIAGVTVNLSIDWPNGTQTLLSTVTDDGGIYSFDNLLLDENMNGLGTAGPGSGYVPGSEAIYIISVDPSTLPTGAAPTQRDRGGDDTLDSDGENNRTLPLVVRPIQGTFNETYDFGYIVAVPEYRIDKRVTDVDSGGADGIVDAAGDVITYAIVVTNTGTQDITGVVLSDALLQGPNGSLAAPVESMTADGVLSVGETFTYGGTYTVQQGDIDSNGTLEPDNLMPGFIDNLASVMSNEIPDPQMDRAAVPIALTGNIAIEKFTNGHDADDVPGPYIAVGDPVTWTYEVTNTGNVPLSGVTVVDDINGPVPIASADLPVSTGLVVRFEADSGITTEADGTTVGTPVTGWSSNGGTGLVLQASGGATLGTTPNGQTAIRLDGTDGKLESAANDPKLVGLPAGNAARTMYFVVDYRAANGVFVGATYGTGALNQAFCMVVDHGTDRLAVSGYGSANDFTAPMQNAIGDNMPPLVGDDWFVQSVRYGFDPVENAWTFRHYRDGLLIDTVPHEFATLVERFVIGAEFSTPTNGFGELDVAAVLVYDRELGDDEHADTVQYLRDKYFLPNSGTGTDTEGCPKTVLGVRESMTCTVTGTATAGQYMNTGTVTGTPPAGPDVPPASDLSHYFGVAPGIDIKKFTNDVDAGNPTDTGPFIPVGDAVAWRYVVTNTSNVPLTNVTVRDSDPGVVVQCRTDTLEASGQLGDSMACTASGTATAGQYMNTGTVTGTPPAGPDVTASDLSHYFGVAPGIDIKKFTNDVDAGNPTDTGPFIPVGDAVAWRYVVTNTSNVPLTNVTVRDSDPGVVVQCRTDTLEASGQPGDSMACTASGTATAGQYMNTGTVTGTPPAGPDVTASDLSHYFGVAPGIDIKKFTNDVDAGNPTDTGPFVPVGDEVAWRYVVTNTSNVPLTNVTVRDSDPGVVVQCRTDTLEASGQLGDSMACTASGTAAAGQYMNTGTVTGTPPAGPDVTASDLSHYFGVAPGIDIKKFTNDVDAGNPTDTGPLIPLGDEVTWRYVVTNTSNVPLTNVTVDDSDPGVIVPSANGLPVTDALVVQLESDSGITEDAGTGAVMGWASNGGTGLVLEASGGPTLGTTPNGQPAIKLDGVDDKLESAAGDANLDGLPAGNAARTLYFVVDYKAANGVAVGATYGNGAPNEAFCLVVDHGTDRLAVQGFGGANDFTAPMQNAIGDNDGSIGDDWFVHSVRYDGTTILHYRDGVLIDTVPHVFATMVEKFVIGAEVSTPPRGFGELDVAAVLVYDKKLSDNEDAETVAYLTRKYLTGCPQSTLAANESMTCTVFGTAVAGRYENLGTATGTPPFGAPVMDTDLSHYFGVGTPNIDIRKNLKDGLDGPDGGSFPPGSVVPFEIVVTNTGDVKLTDVVVTDEKTPACDNNTIGSLEVGGSFTYPCEAVLSGGANKQFRDEFEKRRYDNNDGKHDWSGPWVEYDVAGAGPMAGNVIVGSNGYLWLDDYPNTGTSPSAARSADLSGATSATLSFDWLTHSRVDTSDKAVVEISRDGVNFEPLEGGSGGIGQDGIFTGFSGSKSGSQRYDISQWISPRTTVRVRIAAYYGASNETFKLDNVTITTQGFAEGFVNEACVVGRFGDATADDCDSYVVEVAASCTLDVQKSCLVDAPPSGDLLCTDKIAATTLRYTGPDLGPLTLKFAPSNGGAITYNLEGGLASGTVLPGGIAFTMDSASRGVSDLGSKVYIYFNNRLVEIIHTSCSAIYQAGAPAPLDGGSPGVAGNSNPDKGDPSPNWFVLNYKQKDDRFVAAPDPVPALACEVETPGGNVIYRYTVTNSGPDAANNVSVTDSVLGHVGSIASLAAGESVELDEEPVFVDRDVSNTAFASAARPAAQCTSPASNAVTVTVVEPRHDCSDGKPDVLTFRYTGENCSASDSDFDKSECFNRNGGLSPDGPVTVTYVGGNASGSKIHIEPTNPNNVTSQLLSIGDTFQVDAGSQSRLESNTKLEIRDQRGTLRQFLEVHTSCSAPADLDIGDQHGGLELIGYFTDRNN